MTPEKSSDIVARGLALLSSKYSDKVQIKGLLTAYLLELQELEDATYSVLLGLLIDNAIGFALDALGDIVVEARRGRGDEPYRLAIRVASAVNRSRGRNEDLIAVLKTAGATSIRVEDGGTATLRAECSGVDVGGAFDALSRAKAAGVRLVLVSPEPPTEEASALRLGSVYSASVGRPLASVYTTSISTFWPTARSSS